MSENGPLATTVQDCALALSVMAGRPELAQLSEPAGIRIGVVIKAPMLATPVDAQWQRAAHDSAAAFRESGHDVADARPPYTQAMLASELVRWFAGTEMDARLLTDRSRLGRRIRVHAALGRAAMRAGLPRPAGREKWHRHLDDFFGRHDVLLTPTLAQPPKPAVAWSGQGWFANVWSDSHYAPFCAPWNLAGWPAIAVPAGVHSTGTPLSVQLVARPGNEALLLGLAAQLERRRPWPLSADPTARTR
jgi:amidase